MNKLFHWHWRGTSWSVSLWCEEEHDTICNKVSNAGGEHEECCAFVVDVCAKFVLRQALGGQVVIRDVS